MNKIVKTIGLLLCSLLFLVPIKAQAATQFSINYAMANADDTQSGINIGSFFISNERLPKDEGAITKIGTYTITCTGRNSVRTNIKYCPLTEIRTANISELKNIELPLGWSIPQIESAGEVTAYKQVNGIPVTSEVTITVNTRQYKPTYIYGNPIITNERINYYTYLISSENDIPSSEIIATDDISEENVTTTTSSEYAFIANATLIKDSTEYKLTIKDSALVTYGNCVKQKQYEGGINIATFDGNIQKPRTSVPLNELPELIILDYETVEFLTTDQIASCSTQITNERSENEVTIESGETAILPTDEQSVDIALNYKITTEPSIEVKANDSSINSDALKTTIKDMVMAAGEIFADTIEAEIIYDANSYYYPTSFSRVPYIETGNTGAIQIDSSMKRKEINCGHVFLMTHPKTAKQKIESPFIIDEGGVLSTIKLLENIDYKVHIKTGAYIVVNSSQYFPQGALIEIYGNVGISNNMTKSNNILYNIIPKSDYYTDGTIGGSPARVLNVYTSNEEFYLQTNDEQETVWDYTDYNNIKTTTRKCQVLEGNFAGDEWFYMEFPQVFTTVMDISFDTKSPTSIPNMDTTIGEKMFEDEEIPTATKYGYDFLHWLDIKGDIITQDSIAKRDLQGDDGTIKLTAEYAPASYVLTFDANGGVCDTESKEITFDSTYGELPTATRDGYKFLGWAYGTSSSTLIQSTDKVSVAGDGVVYAQWEGLPKTYTLNLDGGEYSKTTITLQVDAQITNLGTPNKTGYTFVGWFVDETTQVKEGDVFTYENYSTWATTINAKWEERKFQITYDLNGGSFEDAEQETTEEFTFGNKYSFPTPIKNGYAFVNWYDAAKGYGFIENQTAVLADDLTLTAIWKTNLSTVAPPILTSKVTYMFNANGGECDEEKRVLEPNVVIGELPIPTRTGYIFDGWYTNVIDGEEVTENYFVGTAGEVEIYAMWTKESSGNEIGETVRKVTYLFNANEGNCYELSRQVVVGEKIGELPIPVRSGYDFVGWYTEKINGVKIDSAYTEDEEKSIMLYAHWKAQTVEVPVTPDDTSSESQNNNTDTNDSWNNGATTEEVQTGNNNLKPIKVPKVKSVKLKNIKGKIRVTFGKVTVKKHKVKYQMKYARNKKFKSSKSVYNSARKIYIKKPKKGQTYYVRVRAYVKSNGITYYGKWSTTKKIRIKK